ncbi:MAG: hypothetical protein ACI8RD_003974 [Bacillariaceae sp.]|jgi:hypothetical protein
MTEPNNTNAPPVVTKDPRFLAGRKLCERGLAEEAIEMYAILLEETSQKYGENSIETAPTYYEYGNSLLRATNKQIAISNEEEEIETKKVVDSDTRSVAAAAAERRQQQQQQQSSVGKDDDEEEDKKPAAVTSTTNDDDDDDDGDNDNNNNTNNNNKQREEEEEEYYSSSNDDLNLALEMMENAFSIMEEYKESNEKKEEEEEENITRNDDNDENKKKCKYYGWVKEQIPRILLGIGDTLSTLSRHADAADAFSRALELRKVQLQELVAANISEGSADQNENQHTIEHLQAHRMVCEANILIAEELLSCPPNEDVVTTETQSLIVKANECVSYARGYYDQARDSLVSSFSVCSFDVISYYYYYFQY